MKKFIKKYSSFVVTLMIIVLAIAVFGSISNVNADITNAPSFAVSENQYFVYIDSVDGQIYALSSSRIAPEITYWESELGYIRVQVSKDIYNSLNRDKKITLENNTIILIENSVNSIQPVISEKEDKRNKLETKFKNRTHNDNDILEYLQILGGF